MNCARPKFQWLAAVSAAIILPACSLAGAATNTAATPPLPPLKSPVEAFRALLLMPAVEQQKLLAIRPPETRERILEKINEYRALTPEDRELRLQATELRWYLLPLMSMPATNRAAHLARIPQPMRELVKDRLQHWTLFPPALRQLVLTNQEAVSYLTHFGGGADAPSSPTEALRRKMQETVKRFFELTNREKEKALGSLSEAERQQMETTLAAFEQLTPAQRGRCVRSFAKFATMNSEERQEFLKSAERWSQMSPTERETWRELVSLAPMLPPLPYPPMPPRSILPVQAVAPVGTNGN
jgi:hypothetical protein